MKISLLKGESFVSILITLILFSLLFLSYHQWQQTQIERENRHFQHQQALLIAENQIARQLAGLKCESRIQQNQIAFQIHCRENGIKVTYPLGQFELNQ